MKSEKGITLSALVVYIMIFIAVVGLLASLSNYVTSNLKDVNKELISSEDFNKFNTEFVTDVKQSTDATVLSTSGKVQIVLSNGVNYNYIASEKTIYKDHVKLSSNVVVFRAEKTEVNEKKVIKITIGTGTDKENPSFGKTIKYVLNYWE